MLIKNLITVLNKLGNYMKEEYSKNKKVKIKKKLYTG